MRGAPALAAALALAACAPVPPAAAKQETAMFTASDLDKLDFLLGRWVGTGPDGKPFYEAYRRTGPTTLVSERYADETFAAIVDGSTVALEDGRITSTWGEFTWVADRIEVGLASFAPANAPSAFTWRRVDSETVEVTQNWTDDKGVAQSYALQLKKID
jgi:hypothetical protein